MNVGIFGGTFNPPHIGHLIVIESVQDQLHYDKIFFIPTGNPPHKSDPNLAPAQNRFEMTKLAIGGQRYFEALDVELKRGGRSYSIDTLAALELLYPQSALSLIIGVDNFIEFETWKSAQEIFARAEVVVMNRQGFLVHSVHHEFARKAHYVNVPNIGISSTDVRRRIKLGRSIRYLVPVPVETYILRNGLYRD